MRADLNRARRPFWLPASNYYVLTVGVSAVCFFLIWGVLHDDGEEMPWITAGIVASLILCAAVVLREMIFRRERARFFTEQRRLAGLANPRTNIRDSAATPKLTLELNAVILGEIKRKSDAANTLSRVSAGHREVVQLCGEYIARTEVELKTVSPASPRLAPLLRGRSAVSEFHKYHLLKWAEIEARSLTQEARSGTNKIEKIKAAQKALEVVDSALESYPSEASLLESQDLLREMVVSIKVAHRIKKAEKASSKGDFEQARILYRDALFDLSRDNVQSHDREQAAVRIRAEIEKIRTIENGDAY